MTLSINYDINYEFKNVSVMWKYLKKLLYKSIKCKTYNRKSKMCMRGKQQKRLQYTSSNYSSE